MVRRAARQLALLDEDDVASCLRQVKGTAHTGNAAADYDVGHARTSCDVQATMRVRSPRKTSRAAPTPPPPPSYAPRPTSSGGSPSATPRTAASSAVAEIGSIRSTARTGASSPSNSYSDPVR